MRRYSLVHIGRQLKRDKPCRRARRDFLRWILHEIPNRLQVDDRPQLDWTRRGPDSAGPGDPQFVSVRARRAVSLVSPVLVRPRIAVRKAVALESGHETGRPMARGRPERRGALWEGQQ